MQRNQLAMDRKKIRKTTTRKKGAMRCVHCNDEDAVYVASFHLPREGLFAKRRLRRYPVGAACAAKISAVAPELDLRPLSEASDPSFTLARVDRIEKEMSGVHTNVTRILVVAGTLAALLGVGVSFGGRIIDSATQASLSDWVPEFMEDEGPIVARREIEAAFDSLLRLPVRGPSGSADDMVYYFDIEEFDERYVIMIKATQGSSGGGMSGNIRKGNSFEYLAPTSVEELFAPLDDLAQFVLEWPGAGDYSVDVVELHVPEHATHLELYLHDVVSSVAANIYALAVPASWYAANEDKIRDWELWRLPIISDYREDTAIVHPGRSSYDPKVFIHRFWGSELGPVYVEIAREPKIAGAGGPLQPIVLLIWSSFVVPLHDFRNEILDQTGDDPIDSLADSDGDVPIFSVSPGDWLFQIGATPIRKHRHVKTDVLGLEELEAREGLDEDDQLDDPDTRETNPGDR